MSSLLEEAIVDAKALKEAALKNAENAVLEKYSTEVRSALDVLLEQEDPDAFAAMPPLDETEEAESDPELTKFTEDVPYAFQNEELDAPRVDEIIEIDFDALKERLAEEEEVVEGADMIDATDLAEEIMDEQDTDPDVDAMERDNDRAETGTFDESQEEDIALTEEMLSDLIEELVVDMNAVPDGWSSGNSADNMVVQANNNAMAAAQGAHLEEDEELEEEVDTASDVVSSDGLYEAKISQLTESTKELRTLLFEAKSQLTKLNLENAKLVYQNKALSSASLNERQKDKIVEAVQSANSVEEASIIFETIQNAVGTPIDRRPRPQTLREAVARPTSLLLNSNKRDKKAIKDPGMGRMLHLAGLTNK